MTTLDRLFDGMNMSHWQHCRELQQALARLLYVHLRKTQAEKYRWWRRSTATSVASRDCYLKKEELEEFKKTCNY